MTSAELIREYFRGFTQAVQGATTGMIAGAILWVFVVCVICKIVS